MISLQCEACHGTMDVDEDREVIRCPYCGATTLIPISDEVRIEKIKQNAEIEKQKQKNEHSAIFWNGVSGGIKSIFKGCLMWYVGMLSIAMFFCFIVWLAEKLFG